MSIPIELQQAIEQQAIKLRPSELAKARAHLTESYRDGIQKQWHIQSQADRLAYIAARMPATYSASVYVLKEIQRRMPQEGIHSILDLGAGPGTCLWAAQEIFGSPQMSMIERDGAMIALGKQLADKYPAAWIAADIAEEGTPFPSHDLVIMSYSLGEIAQDKWDILLNKAWQAAKVCIVIIEPGSPKGFGVIKQARQALLELGGSIVAPCPHGKPCPIGNGDWCHFSIRLERSHLHQTIKEAERSFEDEKFSYVIVSKTENALPPSRIIRHPMKHSGHVNLTLCTNDGKIQRKTVSRKQKDLYKQARDASWGDSWV